MENSDKTISGSCCCGAVRFTVKGKPGITFPIKLKDTGLAGAFTYLRSKKCFPESESEDDYCFGDDYGMVRDRAARGAVGARE
ncbi:MAG: hypothetical protein AAFY05_12065, partial [Pseudomonadota bacterium]